MIHSLVESELGAGLPLHISLSAPLMLLTEQRQYFLETVEDRLSNSSIRPYASYISTLIYIFANKHRFQLDVADLHWVSNLESTRWFLVLGIMKPEGNELNRLLRVSNQAALDFGQPSLYTSSPQAGNRLAGRGRSHRARVGRGRGDLRGTALLAPRPTPVPDQSSSFHISIAWSLKPPSTELQAALTSVGASALAALSFHVESLKVKIGNTISVFQLSTKARASKGILGS